uniref:EOG090X07YX n=1 Tax=Lynceus sp. MCZ IZ 141354 TaxID=1930659 RepID=A0A9N6WUM5_9CRUS|nr:EOG090X07YX [Lynceus sp. MCZ IZ 141354]
MNFRPVSDLTRPSIRGTKPLPEPAPVSQVLLLMIVHLCRKILFIDPSIKVGVYVLAVFFGSVVADVLPIPRSYFSYKDNFLNIYFVKWSWGWTMVLVGTFLYLTSKVYCCGDNLRIRRHFGRLLIATAGWLFFTRSFVHIEDNYGYCSKNVIGRKNCLHKGHIWQGFSISGHTFILIYCTLILMEEAKALIGWEGIKDFLRLEEYNRANEEGEGTALENLSDKQFESTKAFYEKYTPYVRITFIGMAMLSLIWDVMLISTTLYFHTTPEKFVASICAVLFWFGTYRFWFLSSNWLSPGLPGEGVFQYMNPRQPMLSATLLRRRSSLRLKYISKTTDKIPTFMGMPLNPLRNAVPPSQYAVATE